MRAWRGHLVLMLMMAGLVALHLADHRSNTELRAELAHLLLPGEQSPGSLRPSRDTLEAMHILLNRPQGFSRAEGQQLSETLLAKDDPLLREFALSIDLCRLSRHTALNVPATQEQHVLGGTPPPMDGPWWLEYVTYRRKVGGKQVGGRRRLDNLELLWYRRALRGESPPHEELSKRLLRAAREARVGPIPRGQ
ncbi:MAG: hypothetical protein CMJ86_04715 [Planctomycetes bacterium]|nr:hypothetical protein [Planctomycetota bacterium]